MYFSSFLVLDKRTDSLRLTLPPGWRAARFAGAVELSAKAVEQLYGRASRLSSELQLGVGISQPMDGSGSYLLYLQPNPQLQEKYRAFMQRVMASVCGCICFGERINYNRMGKRQQQVELPDQSAYFITEKGEDVEAYRIKSLADNRLEVGLKLPKDQIRPLSCVEQDKNRTLVLDFLEELELSLQNKSSFANLLNLNDVYDDIGRLIGMKSEVAAFKRDVLSTTHQLIPKAELERLCQAAASICYRHSSSRRMVERVLQWFRDTLKSQQQGHLRGLLEEVDAELRGYRPASYSELVDVTEVQGKLLESRLAALVDRSHDASQEALFAFFREQSARLFADLSRELQQERETKRCLTEEIYEQIRENDSLKVCLQAAKNRLEELSDFDLKMQEKRREIEELRISSQETARELLAEREKSKHLWGEVGRLEQILQEHSLEKGRMAREHQQTCTTLTRLRHQHQSLLKHYQESSEECKHYSKRLSNAGTSLEVSLSENRDLLNAVGRYKSVVQDIQANLKHLHRTEVAKTNHILQLNMQAYGRLQLKARSLELAQQQLAQKVEQLEDCNSDLTNRVVYYEKLYRLRNQSPCALLDHSSPSSNIENRLNHSISDMVILEQNDENDTSDRLERKNPIQVQLNETFDYRSPMEESQPRRSEGCLDQLANRKKICLQRGDRTDWDTGSSARQSQHCLDLPDTAQPFCKAKYF